MIHTMKVMKMIKLKPCPFCGGQAEIIHKHDYPIPALNSIYVKCQKCGTETKTVEASTEYCANDVVCSAWNQRTYQPEDIEREFLRICESEMEHE